MTMSRWITTISSLALLAALPCPALGQGANPNKRFQHAGLPTLRTELQDADIVLFGRVVPGNGKQEFHVAQVLRDCPAGAGQKVLTLNQNVAVCPPNDLFIATLCAKDGKLEFTARASNALAVYVHGILRLPNDRAEQLRFFFNHLDHPDDEISCD